MSKQAVEKINIDERFQLTPSDTMISYAQNREDVVLSRALNKPVGFFIDIGAYDPVADSVTKMFYDKGWSGINIEPIPTNFRRFITRDRDINLQIVVGETDVDQVVFHYYPQYDGWSTVDKEISQIHTSRGIEEETFSCRQMCLASLLKHHLPKDTIIDFMKIDVEGAEGEVLRGNDWKLYRPRVIVIEDTLSDRWLPFILSQGYVETLHDGLNRFFVEESESTEVKSKLRYPASVLDGFETFQSLNLRKHIQELTRRVSSQAKVIQDLQAMGTSSSHSYEDEQYVQLRSEFETQKAIMHQITEAKVFKIWQKTNKILRKLGIKK